MKLTIRVFRAAADRTQKVSFTSILEHGRRRLGRLTQHYE